jgi:hypothetical protein
MTESGDRDLSGDFAPKSERSCPDLSVYIPAWSGVLFEKLVVVKLLTFYGNRNFIIESKQLVTGPLPEPFYFNQLLMLFL